MSIKPLQYTCYMLHALNEQLSRMLAAQPQQVSSNPLTIVAVRWRGHRVPRASHNIPSIITFKMAQNTDAPGYDAVAIGKIGHQTDPRRGCLYVHLAHTFMQAQIGTIQGNTITCTRTNVCKLVAGPDITDLQLMLNPQSSSHPFVQWIPQDVPTEIGPGTILLVHTRSVTDMRVLTERVLSCFWVLYCLPELPAQDVYLHFILNAYQGTINANNIVDAALLRRPLPLSVFPATTTGVTSPPVQSPRMPMHAEPPPHDDDDDGPIADDGGFAPQPSRVILPPPPMQPPDIQLPGIGRGGGNRPPPPGRGRGAPQDTNRHSFQGSRGGGARGRGFGPPPAPDASPPPPPPSQPRPQWYQKPS